MRTYAWHDVNPNQPPITKNQHPIRVLIFLFPITGKRLLKYARKK